MTTNVSFLGVTVTDWARRSFDGGPLVIGHRGSSARAPENSLEAFQLAAADRADGVELDVLCCATGEVVVFHDDDLARLGDRPDRIAQLSLSKVREVRLRSGARIPTLDEAFEACGPDLLVNVELKATGSPPGGLPGLVKGVARSIQQFGKDRRVLVSSFSPLALRLWQRQRSDVPIALLFEKDAPFFLRRAWPAVWLRPWALHPENVLCAPSSIDRWRRRGRRLHVWTVDEPSRLDELRRLGVDGIITNDPARTRAILAATRTT